MIFKVRINKGMENRYIQKSKNQPKTLETYQQKSEKIKKSLAIYNEKQKVIREEQKRKKQEEYDNTPKICKHCGATYYKAWTKSR